MEAEAPVEPQVLAPVAAPEAAASTTQPTRRNADVRTSLTNEQRLAMCLYREEHPKMNQEELAQWAKTAFGLNVLPSQSTVSYTLKRKRELEAIVRHDQGARKTRTVKVPALDEALAEWVTYCMLRGETVSGEHIKQKAAQLCDLLALDSKDRPNFSNGWLSKFTVRHGLKGFNRLQKELRATEQMTAADRWQAVKERVQAYAVSDVFTLVETGLVYAMPPDHSLARQKRASTKLYERRLTLALAANAIGSELLPPLFIGSADTPPALHSGRSFGSYGLSYARTGGAWMTRQQFVQWLTELNIRFIQQQRRVIFVVDYAPWHYEMEHKLSHIELVCLPPRTSAQREPLGALLVAGFKRRYRHRQLRHALDKLEDKRSISTDALYDVHQLQAMLWARDCWHSLPSGLVCNAWNRTNLLKIVQGDEPGAVMGEAAISEATLDGELESLLKSLQAAEPMRVDELLRPLDEESAILEVDDAEFVTMSERRRPCDATPAPQPPRRMSSTERLELLDAFRKVILYADAGACKGSTVADLRRFQQQLREEADAIGGRE